MGRLKTGGNANKDNPPKNPKIDLVFFRPFLSFFVLGGKVTNDWRGAVLDLLLAST